jgi:Zn-dependent protease
MGHVLAYRRYGENSDVVLYGWGGLTIPHHRVRGVRAEAATALAGPAAGFAIAAAALLLSRWATVGIVRELLGDLVIVNSGWSLVNLLPVYPLDGWRISQALLPRTKALLLSAAVAGLMAVAGLAMRSAVVGLGFAVLAVSSLQAAEAEK